MASEILEGKFVFKHRRFHTTKVAQVNTTKAVLLYKHSGQ